MAILKWLGWAPTKKGEDVDTLGDGNALCQRLRAKPFSLSVDGHVVRFVFVYITVSRATHTSPPDHRGR